MADARSGNERRDGVGERCWRGAVDEDSKCWGGLLTTIAQNKVGTLRDREIRFRGRADGRLS